MSKLLNLELNAPTTENKNHYTSTEQAVFPINSDHRADKS